MDNRHKYKRKTIKHLGEHFRVILQHLEIGNGFLGIKFKSQEKKENTYKLDFIKNKNFVLQSPSSNISKTIHQI